jgi:hypothetical protein
MSDLKKPVTPNKRENQGNPNPQNKSATQKKLVVQKKPVNPKKTTPQKNNETKRLQEQLQSAQANNSGLRFEVGVANYFRSQGWNPKMQVQMFGYEYDLFEEKKDYSSAKYLIVECKNKKMVTAEDIIHFIFKVSLVTDDLKSAYYQPPVYSYLCYTGDVDAEAESVINKYIPGIHLVKFEF